MSYAKRSVTYATEYVEMRDIPFILSFIKEETLRVLDAPCGAGRLACQLVEKSSFYTILDIEKNMVRETLRRLSHKGIINNVKAYVGDICEIDMETVFDLIIVPRESIQLLSPIYARRAIANMSKHLVKNSGILILDISTFLHDGDPDYFSLYSNEGWKENWTRSISEKFILKRWSRQIPYDQKINFDFRYEMTRNSKAESWKSSMTLYKYDLAWMQSVVPENVRISNVWGGYDKQPFTTGSGRLIFEIKRV